jgi:hypothetical protein
VNLSAPADDAIVREPFTQLRSGPSLREANDPLVFLPANPTTPLQVSFLNVLLVLQLHNVLAANGKAFPSVSLVPSSEEVFYGGPRPQGLSSDFLDRHMQRRLAAFTSSE